MLFIRFILFCTLFSLKGFSQSTSKTLPPYGGISVLIEGDTSSGNIFNILHHAETNYAYYPDDALHSLNIALELSKQSKNSDLEGRACRLLGCTYKFKGDLVKALEFFLTSLRIHDSIGNTNQYANDLVSTAFFYQGIEDHALSQVYFEKAQNLSVAKENQLFIATNKIAMAENYVFMDNLKQARILVDECYEIFQGKDSLSLGAVYYVQGLIRKKMNEEALSTNFFKSSINYFEHAINKIFLIDPYLKLAATFYEKKIFDSAIHYSNLSYTISKERQHMHGCMLSCKELYRSYFSNGDLTMADSCQKLFIDYSERFFDLKKAVYLKDLTLKEELVNQEKQRQEKISQSNFWDKIEVISICAVCFLSFIIYFFYSRKLTTRRKYMLLFGELLILALYEALNIISHYLIGKYLSHSLILLFVIFIILGLGYIKLHHWLLHYLEYKYIPRINKEKEIKAKENLQVIKDSIKEDVKNKAAILKQQALKKRLKNK